MMEAVSATEFITTLRSALKLEDRPGAIETLAVHFVEPNSDAPLLVVVECVTEVKTRRL